MTRSLVCAGAVLLLALGSAPGAAQRGIPVQTILERAVADLYSGRIAASVRGFDRVVDRAPRALPQLWQRGIALYYAGRWDDCRTQFEQHRLVNPNDVENAVWHFLCVARAESPERAREQLLPVGADLRVPMTEILGLFRGDRTTEEVLAAAGTAPRARFYADLYIALFLEAHGERESARVHLLRATADELAPVGGSMHAIARVHLGGFDQELPH